MLLEVIVVIYPKTRFLGLFEALFDEAISG